MITLGAWAGRGVVGLAVSAGVGFPSAAAEVIRGLEVVEDPLPYFDTRLAYPVWDPGIQGKRANAVPAVTTIGRPSFEEPLRVLMSRNVYPAEDGGVDVLLRLRDEELVGSGALTARLETPDGKALTETGRIDPLPGPDLYFTVGFPAALAGSEAVLRLRLFDGAGSEVGEVLERFRVMERGDAPRSGRIALEIGNRDAVSAQGVPASVGVPFPRGALEDTDHLRLVDETGGEIPMQAEVAGRWARFGSIRWIMLDFVTDLDGGPRRYFLEFGPDVRRRAEENMPLGLLEGALPRVDAGWLRFGPEGLTAGERLVLAQDSLTGAYVERGGGAEGFFGVSRDSDYEIETHGPVKTVVRKRGWYEDGDGGRFCKYDIRYAVFRDSPVLRITHTWIFTGDGNRDRIAEMGWRFVPAEGMVPLGFLDSFAAAPEWLRGDWLLQFDHDRFEVKQRDGAVATGGRAPGVMAAGGDGRVLQIGVRDFWRNFPAELEFEPDGGMAVRQWPRHAKPQTHPIRLEDAHRLWFAHAGKELDFQLPRELVEDPLYSEHSRGEPHWSKGQPETVNAQGVAKTTELWLHVPRPDAAGVDSAAALAVLDGETARPLVDPQWVARSGVFAGLHPHDPERFPEEEAVYKMQVRKPLDQVELMSIYGKWIYGDLVRAFDPDTREALSLYRIFRKAHWGWPYSFMPYLRLGDPEMLKFARASALMLADVGFCHHVDDAVAAQFAAFPKRKMWHAYQPFRARGFWNRNLIPWAGYYGPTTRMYADEVEQLWHAWYLTGCERARDVALEWAGLTKEEEPEFFGRGPLTAGYNRARWPMNLQKQYLETYKATFDPWFLAAVDAIHEMQLHRLREEGWGGHIWHTGPGDFLDFTGRADAREVVLAFAEEQTDWRRIGCWAATPTTLIPLTAQGYELTGEPRYLERLAGIMDFLRWATYDRDTPARYRGWYTRGDSNFDLLLTSWLQRWYPMALAALATVDESPAPLPLRFGQEIGAAGGVRVLKQADAPILLSLPEAFEMHGPEGAPDLEAREGPWGTEHILPAEAPPGIYEFTFPPRTFVPLPLSEPGNKEVLVFANGDQIPPAREFAQYWFSVPADVDAFWVDFPAGPLFRQKLRQIGIWNPRGERVWEHVLADVDAEPDARVRAGITVPPDLRGEGLWRITWPGERTAGFKLDPRIPARFAHDPARWFPPEETP